MVKNTVQSTNPGVQQELDILCFFLSNLSTIIQSYLEEIFRDRALVWPPRA